MTNTTDDMKAKLKSSTSQKPPVNCLSTEDFESFVQRFEEMQGTVASTHALMLDVMMRTDFEPPVLSEFRKAQRAVAGISESMSKTAQSLNTEAKRIETASTDVLEMKVAHIKKLIAAGILMCNLPGTVGLFLLAWRAGLL